MGVAGMAGVRGDRNRVWIAGGVRRSAVRDAGDGGDVVDRRERRVLGRRRLDAAVQHQGGPADQRAALNLEVRITARSLRGSTDRTTSPSPSFDSSSRV